MNALMKARPVTIKVLAPNITLAASAITLRPAATIDAVNRYAYGANLGRMDWYADGANGAVIGDYVCSGYLYAANVGWINLGSGSPTNGIRCQNLSATDFGVNQDGLGNLRGYAWGANIGWINFETNGAPRVDLRTGVLSGYVWSANCGWIGLSNTVAYVQTDTLSPGNLDANDLPIAWELTCFGTTGVNPNADPAGDRVSNLQEYLAGTNPNDGNDYLRITGYATAPGGMTNAVSWSSTPTRLYYLQTTLSLGSAPWLDSGLGLISPDGATTTRGAADTNAPMRFYRVEAIRALSPQRTKAPIDRSVVTCTWFRRARNAGSWLMVEGTSGRAEIKAARDLDLWGEHPSGGRPLMV
jgi:hypothetical protein